jgi:serine/threonine protein kinase
MSLLEIAKSIANKNGFCDVTFRASGAFKETFSARSSTDQLVAIKVVDRAKIDIDRTKREIEALRRCDSPIIAKVISTDSCEWGGQLFDIIIEEYLDGGSLEDRLKASSLTRDQVLDLARGLASGLSVLHAQKLVHRDIKPANIMFRSNSTRPVLVDFGIVRDLTQTSLTATWAPSGPGTPYYSAPEQLNNDKHMIDWRTDQFSTGVIICQIITGTHPYQEDDANPRAAVLAVSDRRGPTKRFKESMTRERLTPAIRMVAPWSVQRFINPQDLIDSLASC